MSPRGGDEGVRTPDPLLAKQVLSQLSYTPTSSAAVLYGPQKLNNINALLSFPTLAGVSGGV